MADPDPDALAALAALSLACTPAPTAHPRDVLDLPVVLADIDALLALVYHAATKLSLALKPPAPAYSASVPVLRDLAQHVSALIHAIRLLHDDIHGATLVRDVRQRVNEIVGALQALIQALLENVTSDTSGDVYLIRIGTLHDLITNARGPSGIPKDNQAAVLRCWKSDGESLDDGLQEIATLIREAESPRDDAADDLDDGWDEFGLGHAGARLDKDELDRAKNVHQVLRITTLLHKRISLDLLPYPSDVPVSAFDALLTQSNQLLSTSDDLVAALYTPQEPPYLRQEILRLADIAARLRTQIDPLLLHSLAVRDGSAPNPLAKKRADKKWFDTCTDQIARLCTRVSESASQIENANVAT